MAFTIGSVKIRVGADTKDLVYDLDKASRILQRSGDKLKSIGTSLSTNLTLPLAALGAASLKAFSDIDSLKKGLIAVTGSAQKAEKEFNKLKEVAKLPGLGLQEAVKGSVALQAAGFSADEARNSLQSFGNALATVGKGKKELDFVVLALTQLQNKTSGFGQDLRQLVEQLPQLRGALTNAFGTADSEAIAKLGVTGKQVVELLTSEFAKLPKVTGGLKNAFENISDSASIGLSRIGDSLNKAFNIDQKIEKLAAFIDNITQKFENLNPNIQRAIFVIAGLAAAIGPVLFFLGTMQAGLGLAVGLFGKLAAGALLAKSGIVLAMGPVGIALAAASLAVVYLINNWDELNKRFALNSKISAAVSAIKEGMEGAVLVGSYLVTTLLDVSKLMIQLTTLDFKGLKQSLTEIGNKFLGFVSNIGEVTAANSKSTNRIGRGGGLDFSKVNIPQKETIKSLPTFTGASGGGSDKLTGAKVLKDTNKELEKIDRVLKAGLITNAEALEQKLDALFEGKKIAAENGFTAELQKMQDKSNELKPLISEVAPLMTKIISPDIKGRSASEIFAEMKTGLNGIALVAPGVKTVITAIEQLSNSLKKLADSSLTVGIGNVLNQFSSLQNQRGENLDQRIANEKQAVSDSITNEEDRNKAFAEIDKKYSNEKKKVLRDQAKAQKAQSLFSAVLNTAEAVSKALTAGPIAGPILAAVIGGLGAIQIGAIASKPLPSLAIGTDRVRKSGLAEIHKGEAIVPADVVGGGFSKGAGYMELFGRISGIDLILSNKNSSQMYSRLY